MWTMCKKVCAIVKKISQKFTNIRYQKSKTKMSDDKPLGVSTSRPIGHPSTLHTAYATMESRLHTFREWPRAMPQKPRDLARAGFVYKGTGDHVKCFYCNLGLKNWDVEDVPLKEHEKHFPECAYLQQVLADDLMESRRQEAKPKASLPPRSPTGTGIEEGVKRMKLDEDAVDNQSNDELKKLCRENERLKERISCKMCLDQLSEVVFEPCHHFVSCIDCASNLTGCPMCRSEITTFIKSSQSLIAVK